MTGLPHNRLAAVFGDVVIKPLRAFDLRNDDCMGMALQHIAGEQNEQFVAPKNISLFIHSTDTIGITIVGNTQIRFLKANFINEHFEVFRYRWIRVVDGKTPIWSTGNFPYRTAKLAENRRRHRSTHTAAGIHDDLQRSRQSRDILQQMFMIRWNDFVAFYFTADFFFKLAPLHFAPDILNLFAIKRVFANAQFKAVILGGVVAGGHLYTAIHVDMEQRKVHERRGTNTDVVTCRPVDASPSITASA